MDNTEMELVKKDGRIWLCCPNCKREQTHLVYGQIINHEKFKCKNCGTFFIANNCLTGEDN